MTSEQWPQICSTASYFKHYNVVLSKSFNRFVLYKPGFITFSLYNHEILLANFIIIAKPFISG